MKKKLWTQIARLAALTFAAVIIVTGTETMTVEAGFDWDGWTHGDGTPVTEDDVDGSGGDLTDEIIEEKIKEAEERAKELEALMSDKYSDVNTLNATVKMSKNILKAKKKAGAYVKQTPKPSKVVVKGKALKCNKKTKEYAVAYHLWNEEEQKWQVAANGITSPGLYRIWIRGYKDNANRFYTKRIYVYDTADKVKPMSSVKVKVNKVPYSGEPITSDVIASVKLGKTTLTEGKDYTVTYLNNVNSGTGIVRLTATKDSGLVGEKEVNFTITGGTKINKAKVAGLTAKTYNYGKAVTQDMSAVQLTLGEKTLVENTDYAVQYYMNNTKVGTAKIVIAGKGKYYGTITKSFKITKIPITEEMLDEASKTKVKGYTGKAVKTGVGLFGSNGEQLKEKTDYTLSYKNNIKPSDKAVIIVKGKGNYTGTINVYFTIQDSSKNKDTQKAAGIDSETKPEIDEEVTDAPEEPVTDETADTEENPTEDETPAEEETDNTGDEEGTAPDETDNTGSEGSEDADNTESGDTDSADSDDADTTTSDDKGKTDSDDADNTTSDDTDSTDSDDADDNVADETGSTGSDNADNTTSDDTDSTDSEDTSNAKSDDADDAVSDNADSTISDDTLTLPETQADEEPVIPENSIAEDAETNADAA